MGSHLRLKEVDDDEAEEFLEECKAMAAKLQSEQYVLPPRPNPKPSYPLRLKTPG